MKQFNVLIWDFNSDSLSHYDVMPYFRNSLKERIDRDKEYLKKNGDIKSNIYKEHYKTPKTLDEFKKFIEKVSLSQFWSRCEYEIILHGWPVQKNNYKLDVYEQIMMNIDIIGEILYEENKLN